MGVTALALNLPPGEAAPGRVPGGPVAGPSAPEQHTEVVPPVVRTVDDRHEHPHGSGRNPLSTSDDRPSDARSGGTAPTPARRRMPRSPAPTATTARSRPDARLEPRPVSAPRPSAGQEAAFGRPETWTAASPSDRPPRHAVPCPPPPAEALLRAFGPPRPARRGLQDPPGGRPGRRRTASGPWWKPDARSDPWRDPDAPAGLGAPAVYEDDVEDQPGPVVVDAKGRKKLRLRDLSIRLSALVRCSPSCWSGRSAAASAST